MARPDGKLLELLADDPCRDLLRTLLREDEAQTQRQLVGRLEYNSSTVSRRMAQLEEFGLVSRRSSHSPYEIAFPSQTRALLLAAAGLARAVKQQQADEAAAHERDLVKESMDSGRLRDRAREA
jgi:DNA-binding MarR family transcriptional regulator